ncbi:MAG TPA: protein kinase [Gaiella sp.]|uniref:protein kinase domain-containing protein n=1 Tax=Gaiella sp. TaxID=2663207 RepID=UPI002D7ED30E|nr:protein kinase [Gaiella sp.]HET9286982.1 protein kinase [Gaiella sp.]
MAVGRRIAAGDVVAGYEVGELVGRGGMGEVFRAVDVRLDRPVALKLLVEQLSGDDGFRERLLRESRLAASLDHPNVVPIYEAGEADGRLFIAMRYVDGTDLKSLLRREGPLEPERALAIASQVAEALDAAHRKGLVHRDVKPSNVLLDQEGGREHVYLADFGLTQSVSDTGPTDGQLMGTVDYVAPEQIRGDRVDGRADVYALGCLLFETLTGTLPFSGGSDVAVVYAHLEEDPPRASERHTGLPQALDPVLARAIAKQPGDRQTTCGELVTEAREAIGLVQGRPLTRLRVALVAFAAAVLAAATAAGIVLATRGDGTTTAVSGGTLVRIDPGTNEVTASYPVSATPGVVTTSGNRVWLGDFRDGSLWRLDTETGDLQRFTTTGEPRDLTALGNRLYVAGDGETVIEGTVTRYDAVTGTRESSVEVLACSLAAGEGVLWVAGCPFVQRLSTDGGRLRVLVTALVPSQRRRSAETMRSAMRDMAVGAGALWVVGDPVDRRVFRVDRLNGEILGTTPLPFAPRSIAVGEGAVWVTGPMDDVVARLEPTTGRRTQTIEVGRGASGVAVGDGSVWVTSSLDREVSRIDPTSGEIVARIGIEGAPREVVVGAGGVWVTTDAG